MEDSTDSSLMYGRGSLCQYMRLATLHPESRLENGLISGRILEQSAYLWMEDTKNDYMSYHSNSDNV
jgi:hypothetical protein